MSANLDVYDLGDGAAASPGLTSERSAARSQTSGLFDAPPTARRAPAPASRRVRGEAAWPPRRPAPPEGARHGLSATLSLLVPGAGQILRGDIALGLCFFCVAGFLGSFAWAVLETLDRLAATLPLLGLSVVSIFWSLAVVYVLAALIHLGAVWNAMGGSWRPARVPPLLSGAASLLVPGWGQLINGDRLRAVLFVGGLWLVGASWVAGSGAAMDLLNVHLPAVSAFEEALRRPGLVWVVRWTAPLLLWALAVYDAASSAAGRRRS